MKALFLKWQQAFDVLTQRERVLIGLSTLIIIGWLSWLPVESILKDVSSKTQQLKQLKMDNGVTQQLNDSYHQVLLKDPNKEFQQQLQSLNQQQHLLEDKLKAQVVDMVPAEQMPVLLEQILDKTKGNTLLSLESIAPTSLLDSDINNAPNLYRHGIKIKLSSSYFDFLDFVKAVDSMPKKLYWQRLDYQVKAYPQAEVELELYSLSLSKEFIRVTQN
ncbi:MSHA biogenesis protein MshJ [Shewanella sp. OPT22]|nr:MSHA biogenesis protein MshJ [Shewanella sp. OPT22]